MKHLITMLKLKALQQRRVFQASGAIWLLSLLVIAAPAAIQAQLQYTTNSDEITITGYTGTDGTVIIPSTIFDIPVTRIGNNAFDHCTILTNITIPYGVKTIGDYAFIYTSLGTIDLPNSVTSIGIGAFGYCKSMTNITLPNSLTDIGSRALIQCTALNNVVLPDSVTSISNDIFNGCSSLANITLPKEIQSIGSSAFYYCPKLISVYFYSDAPSIGSGAFGSGTTLYYLSGKTGWSTNYGGYSASLWYPPNTCAYMTNNDTVTITKYLGSDGMVTITNIIDDLAVTTIGADAFSANTSLTNISVPFSVSNIVNNPFSGASGLLAITVDPLNPNYCTENGVLFNSDKSTLIAYPKGLPSASYAIPENVVLIGPFSFGNCRFLNSISFPNTATTIGDNAFDNSTGLKSLVIGPNVRSIGTCAFRACNSLTNVVIQDCVTNIGASAFQLCSKMTNASIGSNVDSIGASAFAFCGVLTNIVIPDKVTSIGNGAFDNCARLVRVTLGQSLTSIGEAAFKNCIGLKSIVIPEKVTTIARDTFNSCTSLTNATIGTSVTIIGTNAFSYCPALATVTIPTSVTRIEKSAFWQCYSLVNVTIPGSVTNIGPYAFQRCTALTGIYFLGDAPSIGSYVFNYDAKATVYYLPDKSGWSSPFGDIPAVAWNPQMQSNDENFGVRTNKFGFNITGSSNLVIVVEACTNIAYPVWCPLSTIKLNTYVGTNGMSYFSDSRWTNYSGRFYRLRSP